MAKATNRTFSITESVDDDGNAILLQYLNELNTDVVICEPHNAMEFVHMPQGYKKTIDIHMVGINGSAGVIVLIGDQAKRTMRKLHRGKNWEPIETAPMDGTPVLGANIRGWDCESSMDPCKTKPCTPKVIYYNKPRGQWIDLDFERKGEYVKAYPARWWMPLPEVPESLDEDE